MAKINLTNRYNDEDLIYMMSTELLPCQTGMMDDVEKQINSLRETLKIITLEERFRTSIDLLKCNRMVRNSLGPRLREIVSRGWQRLSAFFNPGQSISDLEMMAQANAVRKIESQNIGELHYDNATITIVAALDEQGNPIAQAYIYGATDLVYGDIATAELATGNNVTEAVAKAKEEIRHRKTVLEMIEQTKFDINDTTKNRIHKRI